MVRARGWARALACAHARERASLCLCACMRACAGRPGGCPHAFVRAPGPKILIECTTEKLIEVVP